MVEFIALVAIDDPGCPCERMLVICFKIAAKSAAIS
jgi:hypothetical protein